MNIIWYNIYLNEAVGFSVSLGVLFFFFFFSVVPNAAKERKQSSQAAPKSILDMYDNLESSVDTDDTQSGGMVSDWIIAFIVTCQLLLIHHWNGWSAIST